MVAGRSGGDALTLRAPLELHGQEAEDFASLTRQSKPGWRFTFHCQTIHVSLSPTANTSGSYSSVCFFESGCSVMSGLLDAG